MSRGLICVLLFASGVAHAEAPGVGSPALVASPNAQAPVDMSDQAIAAMIGVAGGGRTTPGGLVVAGHYFYQLNDQDWFDGTATFVFGSGDAECFRDRMNVRICDHGLADGYGGTLSFTARRFLPTLASDTFWPFVRAGLGAGIVRFSDDEVTGVTLFLVGGPGLRTSIADNIALTAQADFELGFGQFSNDVGFEPQLGVTITAGAEFKL